ncbi:MAG TPA: chemotaxis-specific protein-glutamate methyltransferase CheB [Roseiflexaceae bacterium]|nr:chemotaxis-specific protein-glutamate methyltransferase CheB [Roseiflexaceae bacterium]
MRRTPGQPIRVLLVEDSRAQRELLASILSGGGFQLVGVASNGRAAVEAACRLLPDVIAMDIHLPLLDGYEATRQIMQSCPTPIVLISNGDDPGQRSVQALAAGALAVAAKPGSPLRPEHAAERDRLLTTLRLMADVPVVTRFALRPPPPAPGRAVPGNTPSLRPRILAIAASTGGPAALQVMLHGLGAGFPLPVLVVQHIAQGFVAPLVDWMAATVPLPVRIASQGEQLLPGRVYVAPDGHHLLAAADQTVALRPPAPDDRFCPSADVLFESVAHVYQARAIGVILTGMGDDGAHGLLRLRQAGAYTVGQDRASCVVYGMPAVAAELGALVQIAPLEQIAPAVRQLVGF